MKLKKILSGFLAAAMAVTTMVTASVTAGAAGETTTTEVELSSEISYTNIQKYSKLTITYTPDAIETCSKQTDPHDHGDATGYCTWASIVGCAKGTKKDGTAIDWFQPSSPAKGSSGENAASTTTTLNVSSILSAIENDSNWSSENTLTYVELAGWNATITKVVGTLKDSNTPQPKPASATIAQATIEIKKNVWGNESNGEYNYQGAYVFDVEGYGANDVEKLSDINISTLTLKFTVADAKVGTTAFDPNKISYQININGANAGNSAWNWNPKGSSSYNSTTKEVTVTAPVEDIIGSNGDYSLIGFQLIAMVDKANTTDTVTLTIKSPVKHTVNVTAPTNGTVTPDKTSAAKDEKVTLTVTPATGYELDTLTVKEKTAGTAVTVDETDYSFTMPDDEVTVTAAFKESAVALTGLTLDRTTATILVGNTATLTAAKVPANTTDTAEITWTSSAPDVATVANGVVTAVKAGTATITATCGEKTATCEVTVTADAIACTGVALDATATVLVGGTTKLTATVTPENTTDTVTWKSFDETVATVAADGTVTGVAQGTAKITATCGTKSAECTVTVNKEETVAVSSTPKVLSETKADGTKTEHDIFVISAADVKAATSVTITVTDPATGKKTEKEVTECYKTVKFMPGDGSTDTLSAGENYMIVVTVTGIPSGSSVTVTATVNK